jgi:hypothetical protein
MTERSRAPGLRQPRLLACAAAFACALFALACSPADDTPQDTAGADASDTSTSSDGGGDATLDTSVDADTFQWAVCEPGTPKECVGEHPTTTVLECNGSGDGYWEQPCLDEDDKPVWCIGGACAECIPGSKSCKDDDVVLGCNEQGQWEEGVTCSNELTGQICQQGACVKLCEVNKKFNSYLGCEYWAVDLDNAFVAGGANGFIDANGAQFAIVIGNPDPKYAAEVQIYKWQGGGMMVQDVDSAGVPLDYSPLPPGTLRVFNVPRRDVDATVLAPLAYRVESSIPVAAYQFNPLDNAEPVYSNDASLLLPVNVLGKYYIVMSREQTFDSLRTYLTVVAVQDDTQVSVTVTAPTLASNGFEHMKPGDTITLEMNRFDVLNIETDEPGSDLTGSVVLATRNVAVFAGSEASNAPNTARCLVEEGVCEYDLSTPCTKLMDCIKFNTCCADHLEQQLFPVKTWGKTYLATKSIERNKELDIWRILAAEDGTQVTTSPPQANIPVLNRGEWFEFESDEHFSIVAKKPILVGQFLAAEQAPDPNVNGNPGSGDAGTGDPAFILAVPVEQYRSEYVVLAPKQFEFDYVNITAPKGTVVALDEQTLGPEVWEPVSSQFDVARLLIEDGEHRIVADAPVGVIVYGFDQYVSYGYPGGLDLNDLGLINETGE